MTGDSVEQEARDEAMFREINETFAGDEELRGDDLYVAYCECPDESCVDEIQLPLSDYEAIRAHPRRFIVLPGHGAPELEVVVEQKGGYWVVEKRGVAGQIATATDPRS